MTTLLHKLPSYEGATHRRKIVGRGRSSGHGKTSTRGHKGQKSRTGFRQRPGFESGHVPLYRRLPRHGFNNARFKAQFDEVNVGALEAKFKAGSTVDIAALKAAGLVRGNSELVKLLGAGEVKIALNISVSAASASAIAKVEKAGGKVTVPATVVRTKVEKPEAIAAAKAKAEKEAAKAAKASKE